MSGTSKTDVGDDTDEDERYNPKSKKSPKQMTDGTEELLVREGMAPVSLLLLTLA